MATLESLELNKRRLQYTSSNLVVAIAIIIALVALLVASFFYPLVQPVYVIVGIGLGLIICLLLLVIRSETKNIKKENDNMFRAHLESTIEREFSLNHYKTADFESFGKIISNTIPQCSNIQFSPAQEPFTVYQTIKPKLGKGRTSFPVTVVVRNFNDENITNENVLEVLEKLENEKGLKYIFICGSEYDENFDVEVGHPKFDNSFILIFIKKYETQLDIL